jgi:hypothetical protein
MKHTDQDYEIFKDIWNNTKIDDESTKNQLLVEIYNEFRKSDDKMDCDLIRENIETLHWLAGKEYENDVDPKEAIRKAKARAKASQPKFKRLFHLKFFKSAIAVCMAVVVLLSANAIVANATGGTIVDNVIQLGKNCITFNFKKSKGSSGTMVSNDILYETMRKNCSKYQLSPLLPKMFPQDYKMESFSEQALKGNDTLSIVVGNDKKSIVIYIEYYQNNKDIPTIKVSDTPDVLKLNINNLEIYLSKKADKYIAIFNNGNYVYTITSPLDYDQTKKILNTLT